MQVSATEPDWSREQTRKFWDPSRQLLRCIRGYQKCNKNTTLGLIKSKYIVFWYRFWSVVTGAEIDINCKIGGGLLVPHPSGIVIHPECVIGVNCLIFQQVTLAGKVNIGGHVDIGSGAKLMGPLTVEDHVRIGANSVVTKDLKANLTVVGVPARVLEE